MWYKICLFYISYGDMYRLTFYKYSLICIHMCKPMLSAQHNSLDKILLLAHLLTYHNIVLSRLQPGLNTMFCYLNNTVQQHYITLLPGGQHFQPAQALFKVCIFPWAQPLDQFSVVISPLVKANSLLEIFHFHRSESLWFLSPSDALESGIPLGLESDLSLLLNFAQYVPPWQRRCQNEFYYASYNSESQCKVGVDFTSWAVTCNGSPFQCAWVPTSPASVTFNAFEIKC